MNKQRFLTAFAALAGAAATFLPWMFVPHFGCVSGTASHGWIPFLLYIITFGLSFMGDLTKRITGLKRWLWLLPSAAASLSVYWIAVNMWADYFLKYIGLIKFGYRINLESGLYIAMLSGLAALLFGFVNADGRKAKQQETKTQVPVRKNR